MSTTSQVSPSTSNQSDVSHSTSKESGVSNSAPNQPAVSPSTSDGSDSLYIPDYLPPTQMESTGQLGKISLAFFIGLSINRLICSVL